MKKSIEPGKQYSKYMKLINIKTYYIYNLNSGNNYTIMTARVPYLRYKFEL